MAEPFERRAAQPRLISRVLGGRTQTGAIAEVEGVLADAKRVRDVPPERVSSGGHSPG